MKTNPTALFFAFLLMLTVAGCGGGLCPIDVPDCCRNVVFGCGPFELPFGCSCSDYGYPFTTQSKRVVLPAAVAPETVWNGTLKQRNSSCPGLPDVLKGNLQIFTSSRGVQITVPGYGKLYGQRRSNRYVASGSYSPFTACIGKTRVKMAASKERKAHTSVAMSYHCNGRRVCSAQYDGELQSGS